MNSMVAESMSQSLSYGDQSASLASLCTDYIKITEEAVVLSVSASGTVGRVINDTLHGSQAEVSKVKSTIYIAVLSNSTESLQNPLQYPLVHWTLCCCHSMALLARRYQVILLGEQIQEKGG